MHSRIRQLAREFEEYATLTLSFVVGLILYRRRDLTSASIRRIVVIKLDHIGDIILSIPALANIRAHFPRARIAMVASSSSESIARYIPYVDEVFCYDARFFDRSGSVRAFDLMRGMRFARDIRKRRYDLIVDLRGSFASLLVALTAGSKYRIDRGTYLVMRKLGRTSLKSEHEAEVNLDILAHAGLTTLSRETWLDLTQSDLDAADSLLKEDVKSDLPAPVIIIHPGAPARLKRWPVQNYALLVHQLRGEYNARIILVGGSGEEQTAQSIVSAVNGEAADISGRTTLGQLAAVLKKADLFIGNDSGPMHLAAACGTKTIGLFGPTSPQRFGPYGDQCVALRMENGCPPCMRDQCKRPDYRCIDRISVDDVMTAVRQIMAPAKD